MKEMEIKVPQDSSYVNRVTSLPDEAGMKFYLTASDKFDLIVTRLDIFATSAEDSPSDERKFGYEVNEEERSILFTLDIPQALELLEAYGVIIKESRVRILAQADFKTPSQVELLEQAFEESTVPIVAAQKNLKQTKWGCSNNMYKAEEIKIDVIVGKESWPINKITFLKAESAVKVYFGDKAGYKRMLGHLDTLSSLMGSERKFVYDGDEANSNIIFTGDIAQAFELFEGYELLTNEATKRILEKSGMQISAKSASIEEEFDESKYVVPVRKNPK